MQASVPLSDLIKVAVENQNFNYSQVIRGIANGFEKCGFFNTNNWKEIIQENFVTEGSSSLTQAQIAAILLDVPQFSDDSDSAVSRVSSIAEIPVAQSTPFVNTKNAEQNRSRVRKRAQSVYHDESNLLVPIGVRTPSPPCTATKQKKPNSFKPKQTAQPKTITKRRQTENAKRENTVFTSKHKNLRDRVQPAVLPSFSNLNRPPVTNNVMGLVNGRDAQREPLISITNRRMTRRASQLLEAYSGKSGPRSQNITSITRVSVIFTMIDPKPFKSTLNKFNIFVADLNDKYDYLIADQISRSIKFMCAVVSGKPIISIKWLKALNESNDNEWQDPLSFLLHDDKGETQYKFSLSTTLAKATEKKLFTKCSILVTPKTSIGTDSLKDIIVSGGGKYLKTTLVPRKGDAVFCVSDEKDRTLWPKLKLKYPGLTDIISVEGFLDMIFQYNLIVKPQHKLEN